MASNIGGMATLIGDPPNIIIASRAGLSFNDFLVNLAPLAVAADRGVHRPVPAHVPIGLHLRPESGSRPSWQLDEREVIRDHRLLVRSGVVLAAVMVGFVAHSRIDIEPSMVALLGAGALVAVSRLEPAEYLEEVEWPTLVFFMGLFVMVGALVEVGVIGDLGAHAHRRRRRPLLPGHAPSCCGARPSLSGIVDNIPYVATMSPLVQDLVAAGHGAPGAKRDSGGPSPLGADLGGNATAVGASANVVVIGIAARNGHPISFWTFTKYGLVVAAVTIAIAWPYLWLRYYS